MSRFVMVYVDPEKDQILTDNQVMYMRRDSASYIEVEEGDLHRALDLILESTDEVTIYSKSLVVIDGQIDTAATPNSIGRSILTAMKELATEKQAVIVLHNIEGGFTKRVRSNGEYHINIFSLPDDQAFRDAALESRYIDPLMFDDMELQAVEPEDRIYSYPSALVREVLEDSEVEYSVMQDDTDRIFALYNPFNAWVLLRCGRNEIRENVAPILRKLFENMDSLVTDREVFMEVQEEEEKRETLTRWGGLVAGRHDQSVKMCRDALVQCNDKLVRLRVEMTETLSDMTERERVLRIAAEVRPNEDALALEFSRIYENPWIERIEIDDEGEWMTVFTHTLVMDGDEDIRTQMEPIQERWAGRLVPIGKFSIRVGSSGRVKIKNLTNPKERDGRMWYHPHIPEEGAPCFGTIETSLPKLLAQYEFGSAIHLLTGFLTCCNADDAWGAQICLWEEDAYPKPSSVTRMSSEEAEAVAS